MQQYIQRFSKGDEDNIEKEEDLPTDFKTLDELKGKCRKIDYAGGKTFDDMNLEGP